MDLGESTVVEKVVIYNSNHCCEVYTDCCNGRLSNSIVTLHNAADSIIASYRIGDASQRDVISIDVMWPSSLGPILDVWEFSIHQSRELFFDVCDMQIQSVKPKVTEK